MPLKHIRFTIGLAVAFVVLGLTLTVGFLRATIFSTLPSVYEDALRATEERLGVKKSVDTSFGVARVDESKSPPEIAVGELRSLWKGLWQLNGAMIKINRCLATNLVLNQSKATFRIKVRWVAGNEAVSRSAKHTFQLKVVRADGDAETVIETVKKDVSVGGKGLGGTAFKDGHLYSSEIAVDRPTTYRIVLEASNSNTGASLRTSAVIDFKK